MKNKPKASWYCLDCTVSDSDHAIYFGAYRYSGPTMLVGRVRIVRQGDGSMKTIPVRCACPNDAQLAQLIRKIVSAHAGESMAAISSTLQASFTKGLV